MGGDADELVRVVVERKYVPAGVSQPEEHRAVRHGVSGKIGADDQVVAIAEQGPQDPAEGHLDQGHVLLAEDGLAVALDIRPLEVGLLQHEVVDVEPPGEAGLQVILEQTGSIMVQRPGIGSGSGAYLEDDIAEAVDGDELFQTLLDGLDEFWTNVDEPDLVGGSQLDGEVGHGLLDGVARLGVFIIGLHRVLLVHPRQPEQLGDRHTLSTTTTDFTFLFSNISKCYNI